MFQSQVIGNLGSDAELSDGENGKKYASFSVAHTEFSKDEHGNPIERTIWMNVRWYGYTEKMIACLKRGTKVFISGRTSARAYSDKTGNPQSGLSMMATEVTLCGVKNENPGVAQ